MKNFKFTGLLMIVVAVAFNCFTGSMLATAVGANPKNGALLMNGVALLPQITHWIYPTMVQSTQGMFFAGLYKEIWLDALKDNFYPASGFLSRSTDMSAFVENEVINLAEIGADPAVLRNNTTYPIAVADRTDSPLALPLDIYDTENTRIRNAKNVEIAYDKVASVVKQHKNALLKRFTMQAAHSWAPASNATNTPVLAATGADNGLGNRKLTIKDVISLMQKFDSLDYPREGRILVLNPMHHADLLQEDKDLFKSFANASSGTIMNLYGFEVYVSTATPRFNKSTGAKVAFGAASAGTDTVASFAYLETEVMRCEGTYEMFHQEKGTNPTERADVIGFQARSLFLPIRTKGFAAIYSAAI